VPLSDGRIAFIANVVGSASTDPANPTPERFGVFLAPSANAAPVVVYAGDQLVTPFDIDVSVDNQTLWVADMTGGPDGQGSLVSMPVSGGDPTLHAAGYAPRGVTVADNGTVYFTGRDKVTRASGLFTISGDAVTAVLVGAPFVEPSGIAVLKSGDVLVSDALLGDNHDLNLHSRSGVVAVKGGAGSVFASGFATGYPAGIALTTDDSALIVSAEAPDRSDAVYVISVANPSANPTVVHDKISAYSDSAAGLKRMHGSNTFAWASLTANGGGTIYTVKK
jgi:hypothetical protein